MFKKTLAHQSNATPIRSSARRQLLAAIYEQYPALHASSSESTDGEQSGGLSEKDLGRVILPEAVRSSTIETSHGVEGTLWLNAEGDPLWMSFGRNSKEYIPTLYLLAQPQLRPFLPLIQLHSPLPPPLFTGAPLFIPAVRNLRRPWLLPDVDEGAIVAFTTAAAGRDSEDVQYVGIGRVAAKGGMRAAVDAREKHLAEGVDRDEGKFCDILCIVGDHLWELGSRPQLAAFIPPVPSKPLVSPPMSEAPQAGPSRSRSTSPTGDASGMDGLTINDPNQAGDTDAAINERLSPSEISTLLTLALLQSLSSLEASAFPMPASLLYSAHVLPNRPAYIPKAQREDVVIGKSEWKKLVKWMKEVGKDGLVKIKESKGEVTVQGYDPLHPALQTHVPFLTITAEETKASKRAAREAATEEVAVGGTKGKTKEIAIEELWKPTGPAASFWDACGVDKSSLHPPSLIKSALDGYVVKHNLVDPRDPRSLLLDDELGRACGIKKPAPGEKLAREEVMKKLKAGVAWSVSIDGVIRKGTPSPITMTVKTRQGRKTITTITSLETFSIDVDEFAEEIRKVCAGATSIQPLSGASPKLGLREVMVQGNQVKIVERVLMERGVPRRWIKEGERK